MEEEEEEEEEVEEDEYIEYSLSSCWHVIRRLHHLTSDQLISQYVSLTKTLSLETLRMIIMILQIFAYILLVVLTLHIWILHPSCIHLITVHFELHLQMGASNMQTNSWTYLTRP